MRGTAAGLRCCAKLPQPHALLLPCALPRLPDALSPWPAARLPPPAQACRPGATLRQLHQLSVRLLSEALSGLGLGPHSAGSVGRGARDLLQGGGYRTFYPHSGEGEPP